MPYVTVRMIRDGASAKQKAELIKGITQVVKDTLGKNPASTWVVIEEVDADNWGVGGETVAEIRKKG